MSEVDPNKTEESQEPKINVQTWVKKFEASEKVMKSEFLAKYRLAKARLRAENDIKNKNSRKMTHNNVNLVYSIGNSFVSSVAFKMPSCNLTAREEVEHEKIENTEVAVNDWLKDNKVKKVVQRNIWDAYLGGSAWRFIDHEYEDIEDPNNIIVPEVPAQLDELGNEIAPAQPAQYGRIVLKNEITIQRIRPDMVRFPKGFDFDNYQDSPWLGFDVIMPLDDVRNNSKWDQNITATIEGEKYEKLSDSEKGSSAQSESDELYVKISYCFQKPDTPLDSMTLMIFCHKYPQAPLEFKEFDKGTVGYPLKPLYFNPLDDDCSYPNGDPWNFESQLNAVDTWWRKMNEHVRRSNPKTFYDSGAVTPQEIQKAKTADDLEFVGLTNPLKQPLQNYFYEKERAAVHPDVTNLYQVARQLVSEIGPRSGLSRGAEDKEVDTATEAKIIQTGEVIDVEARIDTVREYIVDIVLDVAGIFQKSMTAPIPIKKPVLDELGKETGEEVVEPVNKEGFTSKVNVDVDVESMQAQNKDVLRRQLLEAMKMFETFKPFFDLMREMPNPKFWTEKVMETMNIRNIEDGFIPMPEIVPVEPNTGQPAAGPAPISDGTGMDVKEDAQVLA